MFLLSTLITKRSTQVKYLSIFRFLALVTVCNPRAMQVQMFPRVLSAFSMKKYPDKTTFNERSLFSVLTVFTTKLHCTMNNNFLYILRDLQLIEYEQRMSALGITI